MNLMINVSKAEVDGILHHILRWCELSELRHPFYRIWHIPHLIRIDDERSIPTNDIPRNFEPTMVILHALAYFQLKFVKAVVEHGLHDTRPFFRRYTRASVLLWCRPERRDLPEPVVS